MHLNIPDAAAAAKLLQSCLTLCDPIDGSPPGSPVSGILQARTLEWVAISFCNEWKWKWCRSVMSDSKRQNGLQPTSLLPGDFPGKSTGVGCHYRLQREWQDIFKVLKGENLQPRLLYPARISVKIDGEIESFSENSVPPNQLYNKC